MGEVCNVPTVVKVQVFSSYKDSYFHWPSVSVARASVNWRFWRSVGFVWNKEMNTFMKYKLYISLEVFQYSFICWVCVCVCRRGLLYWYESQRECIFPVPCEIVCMSLYCSWFTFIWNSYSYSLSYRHIYLIWQWVWLKFMLCESPILTSFGIITEKFLVGMIACI